MITKHRISKFYKEASKTHVIKDSNYHFTPLDDAYEYANDSYCYLNKDINTITDFFTWYGYFREWRMSDIPTVLKVDDHYVHIIVRIDDEDLYVVDLETDEVHLRYGPQGVILEQSDWAKSPYRR